MWGANANPRTSPSPSLRSRARCAHNSFSSWGSASHATFATWLRPLASAGMHRALHSAFQRSAWPWRNTLKVGTTATFGGAFLKRSGGAEVDASSSLEPSPW